MHEASLSCLLAFYGIPIFQTFLIRRIFYLLASFPFFNCIYMHGVQYKWDIFGHKPIKKVTLVALSYPLRRFVVIHVTSVHHKQIIGTDTI